MKEKKDRVEDALHATRAAVEEGVVAGGGVALIRAASKLSSLVGDNEEQNVGIRVALRAMEAPLRQIVKTRVTKNQWLPTMCVQAKVTTVTTRQRACTVT